MGTYPPYQAPLRPQGRHGMRNRFAEGSGRIATEMAPWACIRLSERSRFPGGLARITAEIAQQVSIRFAKHTVLQPRRKARQRKRVCRKDTRRAIVLLKGARGSQQKSQQWGWIAPGACIRFAERLYGPRGTHESAITFLKARMDRIAPWACIRLAERLYGHGGTHGSAVAFRNGPRGSQRKPHHGRATALLSTFRAPEERIGRAIVFLQGLRGSQRRSHLGHGSAVLSAFATTEERMETQNRLLLNAREDRMLPEADHEISRRACSFQLLKFLSFGPRDAKRSLSTRERPLP